MRSFLVFMALSFYTALSFAHLPKTIFILGRVAQNNGKGSYQIEQEVQFQTLGDPVVVKETWLIDSEGSMKLTVAGTKELKDTFKLQFVYGGGTRSWQSGTQKNSKRLTEEFFERYFHVRSAESFANQMIQMKLITPAVFQKKVLKNVKDVDISSEPFVRLARSGGAVNYAFGPLSAAEGSAQSPGLWIEQDQFVLRKIRFNSGAELSAERYSSYSRGLDYPRKRVLQWENQTVNIQTLSVSPRSGGGFGNLEPSRMDGLENLSAKNMITEFYNRFR